MSTVTKDIFDFPVERVPSYSKVKGQEVKLDRDAIFRMDTVEQIGVVSAAQIQKKTAKKGHVVTLDRDYYKVVTHGEIVNEARQALRELGMKPKESTVLLQNGGRMFHQFDFPSEGIEPAKGDWISMRLTLVNSYDLSSRIGFEVGGLRQVCTNGLVAFRKAFFEMKKHAGGFDIEMTVKNLKKSVETFRMEMLGFYKLMGATPLETIQGMAILEEMIKSKVLPEKYGEAVKAVWENPENANRVIPATDVTGKVIPGQFETVMENTSLDRARTVWSFYNALTLILTHYVTSIERRMFMHEVVKARIAKLVK